MTKHTQNPSFFKPNRLLAGVSTAQSAIVLIVSGILIPSVFAQTQGDPTLKPVVITAPTPRQQVSVGGMDLPLREAPLSATVIYSEQIKEIGAQRLSDLFKFDASVSDAYNSPGYIDYATVRGFAVDNKYNIRRDGLPISGDTAIGLANKDRVEILKGTSGIQAGTSAPGGLVNYIVKRPTVKTLRTLDFSVDSNGQIGAAIDLGGRFGVANAQGYRLNFAADRLNSAAPGTRGDRQQLALALDSRIGRDGLLEAEVEWSRQSQRNVPGLSVLGSTGALPSADPKLNLNRQAWSQPTEFEGLTGSLRYTQAINDQWQWSTHVSSQRLTTDDRIAFPYGFECYSPNFTYCDRFNDTGDLTIWDFRSEDFRRSKHVAQLKMDGKLQIGSVFHSLSLGVLGSKSSAKNNHEAFNPVGFVNLAAPLQALTPNNAPTIGYEANIQRETTTEFFATDVIDLNESIRAWLGLRNTRLQRTDALLSAANYSRSLTSPWLALSFKVRGHTIYASRSQGVESDVAARLGTANPGQVLPPRRSQQFELGLKSPNAPFQWQANLFRISRPMSSQDACGLTGDIKCLVQPDGQALHRGIELAAQYTKSAVELGASATLLKARRSGSATSALNGLAPANVPKHIVRANVAYRFAPQWLAGLQLSHEGARKILPNNALTLPSWTQLDASMRWDTKVFGRASSLQLNVSNLLDRRFYKESPYQFGHSYLFPAAPRTLRLSVSMAL